MKWSYYVLLFVIVASSCQKCKESNEELCSSPVLYSGNELQTDGYYYKEYANPDRREILFLFRNGVVLDGEIVDMTLLPAKEEEYMNGYYYNLIQSSMSYWGNFNISGNTIEYELWFPSTNRYVPYVNHGVIINDTTFQIVMSYRCDGTNFNQRADTYHFKKFGPKPDSTNQFVP